MPGSQPTLRSRWLRAIGLATAAAALSGAFANLLFRVEAPPKAPLFGFWSTHLRTPLIPDNLPAENDRAAIAAGGFFPVNTFHLDRGLTADLLRSELERASEDSSPQRVVYLSAYATSSNDGTTLLMTQDFDPLTGQGGLPVESVLTLLDRDARPTLLVLDLSWRLANGKNGLLPCGVGRRLIERLEARPGRNRLTLLSCSQGEAATTIPGAGRTTFGYFFEAGLNGRADGFNPTGLTDAWVSARELGVYVRDRVAAWTDQYGPAAQTPCWIAPGETDFLLSNRRELAPTAADTAPEYPEWLLEAWRRRDAWADSRVAPSLPRLIRRYEVILLDIEQRWRAGFDPALLQADLVARARSVENEFDAAAAQITATPSVSVAQFEADGVNPPPKLIEAWVDRLDSSTTPAAEEGAKVFGEAAAEAPSAALAVAGAAALTRCETDFATAASTLMEELRDRAPGLRLVELDALRRLIEHHEDQSEPNGDLLRAFFETTALREQLGAYTATPDWTADHFEAAHQSHQAGWAALLATGYASHEEAARLNADAEKLYRSALQRQGVIRRASATAQTALKVLLDTTSILATHPLLRDEWNEAASVAGELMELLETSDAAPGPIAKRVNAIDAQTGRLRMLVERLAAPVSAESVSRRVELLAAGDLGQLAAAQALLDTPSLKADERAALSVAVAQAGAILLEPLFAFAANDRPATIRAALTRRLEPGAIARSVRTSRETAIHGATQTAALIRLADADAGRLEDLLSQLDADEFDAIDLLARVRATVSGAFGAMTDDLPLAQRCRACRVLPAGRFNGVLDRRLATPTLIQERNRYARWSQRSAQRLIAESRNLGGSATLSEAAQRLGGSAVSPLAIETLERTSEPLALPSLSEAQPTGSLRVRVRHGRDQPIEVRVLQPADCLEVTTSVTPIDDGSFVDLALRLNPAATPSDQAATHGVLLLVSQGGRVCHRRVDTPAIAGASPVKLYAEVLGVRRPVSDRLALPPSREPTPLRLVAANRTDRPQEFEATVTADKMYRATCRLGPLEEAPLALQPPPADEAKGALPNEPLPTRIERLDIRLRDPVNARVFLERSTRVGVDHPSAYVRVLDARVGPDESGSPRATFRVKRLPGSPSRLDVAWSLVDADRSTNSPVAGGVLAATLTPDNPLATLTAALRPDLWGNQSLRASAELNGVRTAILWAGEVPAYGIAKPLEQAKRPVVRVDARPLLAAGEPLSFSVEAAPSTPGMRLQVGLAAPATDSVRIHRSYDAARCERVLVEPALGNGDLMVTTSVGEWRDSLPTEGLSGGRRLIATVLDTDGAPLARTEASVVIDADPADAVRIAPVGPDLVAGAEASFVVEASDRWSGVKSVRLYVGDPIDALPPEGTKPVAAVREEPFGRRWIAKLPLPAGVSSTRVTAEVTNGVDLVRTDTLTVSVIDAEQASLGSVAGSVLEGTRPQPGLAVELRDPDQQPIAKAKTNAQGKFVFKAVKPGKYLVWSVKEQSQRVGADAVEVKAGDVSHADLKLSL